MNVRRYNELKIQMRDLEIQIQINILLDAIEIQISARSRSRFKSRFQISLAFLIWFEIYYIRNALLSTTLQQHRPSPPPPHTHTHFFLILSLSMTSWRGMWHIWYIHVATEVYNCTLFNTIHILVNYAHNYVSRVSMRIINYSVSFVT